MIKGVHHVAMSTRNIDRLKAFYRDRFGFEVVYEREKAGEPNSSSDAIFGLKNASFRMVMLKGPNIFVEMFEFASPEGRPSDPQRPVCDAGITHLCLSVTDIHGEYSRLKDAGVSFHCPPQKRPGIGQATYGRDPDGNVFELIETDPGCAFA
jgi:catechol 2,3-dioxygenase-like lactoylglutathione lyase family enzyme